MTKTERRRVAARMRAAARIVDSNGPSFDSGLWVDYLSRTDRPQDWAAWYAIMPPEADDEHAVMALLFVAAIVEAGDWP